MIRFVHVLLQSLLMGGFVWLLINWPAITTWLCVHVGDYPNAWTLSGILMPVVYVSAVLGANQLCVRS